MPALKPAPVRYFAVWLLVSTRMSVNPRSEDYERWINLEPRTAFHTGEVPAHLADEYPYLLEHGHIQEITADEFALIRANPPILTAPEPDKEGQDG